MRLAAKPDQTLLLEQVDDFPDSLKGNPQFRCDVGDGMLPIATLHNLEQPPMTFRVDPVVNPDPVSGAKYFTFEIVYNIQVVLPGLEQSENDGFRGLQTFLRDDCWCIQAGMVFGIGRLTGGLGRDHSRKR